MFKYVCLFVTLTPLTSHSMAYVGSLMASIFSASSAETHISNQTNTLLKEKHAVFFPLWILDDHGSLKPHAYRYIETPERQAWEQEMKKQLSKKELDKDFADFWTSLREIRGTNTCLVHANLTPAEAVKANNLIEWTNIVLEEINSALKQVKETATQV